MDAPCPLSTIKGTPGLIDWSLLMVDVVAMMSAKVAL